jgi:hypothetical protein
MTKQESRNWIVTNPEHPEYAESNRIPNDPELHGPMVDLGSVMDSRL